MIVEVGPDLIPGLSALADARDPGRKLLLAVQIVIPVQPVVSSFATLVPYVVVSSMKADINMIGGIHLSAQIRSGPSIRTGATFLL